MKTFLFFIFLSPLILTGCIRKTPDIITYNLKRSDYFDTINVPGTIQAVNNTVLATPNIDISNFLKVSYLAEDGAIVKKGDTICTLAAPELISNLESLTIDFDKMEAEMKKLEADDAMKLSLLQAQVETNKAQLAISMLDSIQMKFAPLVRQRLLALEMEKANVEKRKLQKRLTSLKIIDSSEIIQRRSRIMMQKNLIQMCQSQIALLKLSAPCDGIVMHVEGPQFWINGGSTIGGKIRVGSSVFPGMPLVHIPDMKEMQLSVDVQESDYKRIKEDQKVLISIDAVKNLFTTGKIKRKSLAGKNPQEKSEIKTYEVIISVDSCHNRMKPGLSSRCLIVIDQVKDTVVVPSTAIFTRDSLKIVYVRQGDKFMPVTVVTGLSNSSKSIISDGLSGNETIALIVPPSSLIIKEPKPVNIKAVNPVHVVKDTVLK